MDEYTTSDVSSVFSLTQIRHLMRVEFSRAQRYGYPLSCVLIAVDRAEALRNAHGYELREKVLMEVVDLLQNATRTCDYLGRLMDDRLMAILPHTNREGAETTADRILAAARGVSIPDGAASVPVTLSIGISHYADENTMFFDSLVGAAEAALAEAMEAGGDRWAYRDPGPKART